MSFCSAPAAVVAVVAGSVVVFDPWGWQPFGPSKWLVVTVGSLVGAGLAFRRGVRLHRGASVGLALVVGWSAVTSVTSVDPLSAWLGTPDRRFGFVAVVTLAAAFVAGQSVTSWRHRRWVLRAVVGAVLIAAGYGVVEALGWGIPLDAASGRLGATYGSAAYLGAALPLFVPIAVGVAATDGESCLWRMVGAAAAGGGLFLAAGSGTRAGAVGLVAALVAGFPRWWPTVRRHLVSAAVGAVVIVAALAVSPVGQRIAQAAADPAGIGRVDEWRLGVTALVERPVLGAGWEGYRVVFPVVVDPDHVVAYGRTTVTDRAHSAPLDVGISLGMPGVVLWVVAAVWVVGRSVSLTCRRELDAEVAGLAAGLVGFFVAQLGLFPTVEVDVAAWMLVGVAVAAGDQSSTLRVGSRVWSWVVMALAAAALVAGSLGVWADRRARQAVEVGSVAAADAAVALRPDSYRLWLLAADNAFAVGDLDDALERIDQALGLSPGDPALRVAKARILTAAASRDASSVPVASTFLDRAVAADPNHPDVRYLDGLVHLAAGEPAEAERALLAAESLAPGDVDVPLALARLYLEVGDEEAARDALGRASRIDPDRVEASGLAEMIDGP